MPDKQLHTASWRAFMRPDLLLWGLYLFLTPFYVFNSGLPQPGDMAIVLLVPVAIRGWNGRLPTQLTRPMRTLLWFTAWVCIVNYAWMVIAGNYKLFGNDSFVLFPLYYVYNSLLFVVGVVLYRRHGDLFLRLTLWVIAATVGLLFASSFVTKPGSREALFFNNPNQLGYYSLLAGCLIVMIHRRLQLKLWSSSLMLTACGYLGVLSASRAAIGGVAILFAMLVFANPRVIIGASAVALALLFVGGPISDALEAAEWRLKNRESNVGFAEERGYDRIVEYKEYLLFGAGEGGLQRFAPDAMLGPQSAQKEIHSSFGTVLFSYGVIGAYLFLAFLWQLVRGARLRLAVLLLPPLFYGMAHQGLRFTTMWVLLAVFLAIKSETRREQPRAVGLVPMARAGVPV